jgi:hypothetical protein
LTRCHRHKWLLTSTTATDFFCCNSHCEITISEDNAFWILLWICFFQARKYPLITCLCLNAHARNSLLIGLEEVSPIHSSDLLHYFIYLFFWSVF